MSVMPWVALAVMALAAAAALGSESRSGPGPGQVLPDSYLLRVERALELCRADVPRLQPAAEAAAERLDRGGKLYLAGNRALVSELSGRAGGLMLTQALGDKVPGQGDVVIHFPQGQATLPKAVREAGALLIVLGEEGRGDYAFSGHALEAGISPTLAAAIPAWTFTGELIAALTRRGKMPVLYESIGLSGGVPRMNRYLDKGILWHEQHSVAPIAPGVLGGRYVEAIAAMLRRMEAEERGKLDTAGRWASEAKRAGKRLIMYSMGHLFPDEVGQTAMGKLFASAVWNSGSSYSKPPDDAYQRGDLVIHVGYQHPPTLMLERARAAGARAVYVDILQDRDYVQAPDVIWIDPMWPWADACVPIEGYDIPALAASGVVNGAIAWEIYRCALAGQGGQALAP